MVMPDVVMLLPDCLSRKAIDLYSRGRGTNHGAWRRATTHGRASHATVKIAAQQRASHCHGCFQIEIAKTGRSEEPRERGFLVIVHVFSQFDIVANIELKLRA